MLRIIVQTTSRVTTFRLEGRLIGPWVEELRECWRRARSVLQSKSFVVDLTAVNFLDAAGEELLALLHDQGAELVAAGPMTTAIVQQIASRNRSGAVPVHRELAILA